MNREDNAGVMVLIELAIFVVMLAGFIGGVNLLKNDAFNNGVLAHYRGEYVVQTNLDGSLTVFPKDAVKVVP
jgi:hypothetical protein